MNPCDVRKPTQADEAAILHLIEGQLDVFEGPYDRPAIDDAKDACLSIGDLTDGQSLVAVDLSTGLVIGFGRDDRSQGSYALTHLFVAGYMQGQKVGKRLWNALIEGKPPGTVVGEVISQRGRRLQTFGLWHVRSKHSGVPIENAHFQKSELISFFEYANFRTGSGEYAL